MKKIKNIGKILIVVVVLQFIATGCPGWDPCPPLEKLYYTMSDVKLQNIDNAGKHPIIIEYENAIIPKEAFGIRVTLNYELLSDSINDVVKNDFIKNISLFNSLYAISYDCLPPEIIFKDTIISIKVFTVNDFDNEFSTDSDVSELFKVLYDSLPHIASILPKYISIDEYIRKHSTPLVYPYSPRNENIESIIDLYLMKPPEFIGEHNFRVEVLLSDGKVFSATTPRINLE